MYNNRAILNTVKDVLDVVQVLNLSDLKYISHTGVQLITNHFFHSIFCKRICTHLPHRSTAYIKITFFIASFTKGHAQQTSYFKLCWRWTRCRFKNTLHQFGYKMYNLLKGTLKSPSIFVLSPNIVKMYHQLNVFCPIQVQIRQEI